MRFRVITAVLAATAAAALSGCAAQPLAPAAGALQLAASSTHKRTGKTSIDAFDAWYFCRSKVFEFAAATKPSSDPFKANAYHARFVRQEKAGIRVQIVGRLGQGTEAGRVNASHCVVTGTVAHPKIVKALYPR